MFLPLFLLPSFIHSESQVKIFFVCFSLNAFSNFPWCENNIKSNEIVLYIHTCFTREYFQSFETTSWHFKCSKHSHKSITYGIRKRMKIKKGNEKENVTEEVMEKEVREGAVYAINKNNKFWSIENAKWNGKQKRMLSLIDILDLGRLKSILLSVLKNMIMNSECRLIGGQSKWSLIDKCCQ